MLHARRPGTLPSLKSDGGRADLRRARVRLAGQLMEQNSPAAKVASQVGEGHGTAGDVNAPLADVARCERKLPLLAAMEILVCSAEGDIYGDAPVTGNPQFVNPSGGNFHLQPDSPAIDAGSATDAPVQDFDGRTRRWTEMTTARLLTTSGPTKRRFTPCTCICQQSLEARACPRSIRPFLLSPSTSRQARNHGDLARRTYSESTSSTGRANHSTPSTPRSGLRSLPGLTRRPSTSRLPGPPGSLVTSPLASRTV
jgi:hypothetical protein